MALQKGSEVGIPAVTVACFCEANKEPISAQKIKTVQAVSKLSVAFRKRGRCHVPDPLVKRKEFSVADPVTHRFAESNKYVANCNSAGVHYFNFPWRTGAIDDHAGGRRI